MTWHFGIHYFRQNQLDRINIHNIAQIMLC